MFLSLQILTLQNPRVPTGLPIFAGGGFLGEQCHTCKLSATAVRPILKHGTTQIGDWQIPLLGVPESATLEFCEDCGIDFPLRQIVFTGAHFYCSTCFLKNLDFSKFVAQAPRIPI